MAIKHYQAHIQLNDSNAAKSRRFRNILANSGEILESGEIRDLEHLYVMGTDSKVYPISALNQDPDKQSERYSVKAQADHGELKDGELVPTIEKQFGSCKVWLEDDGLHARMYFANEDRLADHAWAISEDASYSTGIDWFPEGYYGAGNEIDEPIGILREISMVLTGNDPRTKTIDTKATKVHRDGAGDNNNQFKGEKQMTKTKDALTPDERAAMMRRLNEAVDEVIDEFTTSAPESETEPTKKPESNSNDEVEEAPKETTETTPETQTNDSVKHMPVVVVRDRVAMQEKAKQTKDWLTSEAGHEAYAKCLKQAGKLGPTFDMLWRQELGKHVSLDGITGLPTPTDIVRVFKSTLEESDGIISHFEFINTKGFTIDLIGAVAGQEDLARAHGHKPGDTKVDQELENTSREILCKMVYKRLTLNAMDLWENPNLIDFRARELVQAILREIERAAFITDGRSTPTTGHPDLRMYDPATNRGFIAIKSDAAATSGVASLLASTYTQAADDNAYDTIIKARGLIRTEGSQYIVAKNEWVVAALTAKMGNDYLVQPGTTIENLLRVTRVYTPQWMDEDTNDAYLVVDKAYKMIGQSQINTHADFDTSTNENILLDETPRGGALGEYKSAVAIAPAAAARSAASSK